jgi:threonine/homoserine/homoserine lactone efflux protein
MVNFCLLPSAFCLCCLGMSFLLRGLIIGFSIAAPVGPIGILCIRRTLANGRISGLVTGLGAATADAMYGTIAGFGLTAVSSFLVDQQRWLRPAGGLFLFWLGLKTILSKPATEPVRAEAAGLLSDYVSTVFLTLTNPATILSFIAVFAGLGLAATRNDYPAALQLVAGVFLGSALWWLLLSGGIGFFREKFNAERLRWVNWISGLILGAFGLLALSGLGK